MIKNQWYAVLPSNRVKVGKLVSAKRLGLELCFFRNSKGEIACVSDRCSHRGASISKGKQLGDCACCPFHGLRFDQNGRCVQIPANGKKAIVPERYNVKSYKVKEAHGMIYLWNGDGELKGNLPFFEDFIDESYEYSELEDTWKAHYSRCIENQLDVVHLPFVHHNTIGRGNKTIVNGPKVGLSNETIITCANNEVDTGQKPKTQEEIKDCKDIFLQFKFPNVWMNHISQNMKIIIFFVPVDDETTIFYIRFYTNSYKSKLINKCFAQLGKIGNFVIERQDKRIVQTQRPYQSSFNSGEKLLQGDRPIILYRKMREELKEQAKEDN